MLSFAAGANNSRQVRNVKKVQQPRPGWRKHDSESAAFAATRRLFSRGGNRDGALFARAVPRIESLPPGHGGSVCGGISLPEVLVHSVSLHHSLHRLLRGIFRPLYLCPRDKRENSRRKTAALS